MPNYSLSSMTGLVTSFLVIGRPPTIVFKVQIQCDTIITITWGVGTVPRSYTDRHRWGLPAIDLDRSGCDIGCFSSDARQTLKLRPHWRLSPFPATVVAEFGDYNRQL